MRTGLAIAGVLLVAVGLVWLGQGFGYIKGSFMTGDRTWSYIGAACVVAGLALVYVSLDTGRRASRNKGPERPP